MAVFHANSVWVIVVFGLIPDRRPYAALHKARSRNESLQGYRHDLFNFNSFFLARNLARSNGVYKPFGILG